MIDYAEGSGKQYHISVGPEDIGKYVIMPGDPKRTALIAQHFENARLVADNREYVTYTGALEGERVSVTSTGIGGPSAAIALEELVNCGAHTFIRVGTSGGMQIDVKSGDICIATGAIRMEGTSKEYAPIEFPAIPNMTVTGALIESAQALGAPFHVGVVQCKDSFYGQHQPEKSPVRYELENKWQAWLDLGCIASEMESAALFVVGAYRRVRVGSMVLVMANQERAKLGLPNAQVHDMQTPIRVAVEALRRLILQDRKAAAR